MTRYRKSFFGSNSNPVHLIFRVTIFWIWADIDLKPKYKHNISLLSVAIYVDKNNKDPETKNGMSSFLKHNLEDEIAKRKVGKGFKENTYPNKDNFLNKEPVILVNCHWNLQCDNVNFNRTT